MPKPDVVALTGGYRRTPFMQIGADIYCDSLLMCRVIDRLAPRAAALPGATARARRSRRPMGRLVAVLDGGALHDAAGGRRRHLRRRAARVPEGVRRGSRGDDPVAAASAAARRRRRARRVPAADRGDARRRPALPARQRRVDRRLLGRAVDLVHAPRRGRARRCSTPMPRIGAWFAARRRRSVTANDAARERGRDRAGRRHEESRADIGGRGRRLRRRRRGHRHRLRLRARRGRRKARRPRRRRSRRRTRRRACRPRPRPFPTHRLPPQGGQEGSPHEEIQGRHRRHHRRRLGLRPRDLAHGSAARHERRHGRRSAGRARSRRRRVRALGAEVLPFRLDVAHAAEVEALGAATKARSARPTSSSTTPASEPAG